MDEVVVTGAAGFIGSHVATALNDAGNKVILTDITLPEHRVGDWRRADLTRYDEILELTRNVRAVCHIGGIGDVYLAASAPQLALHVNVCGTLNILEACRVNHVERVVYASTWEVYGAPRYEPIDENHPCLPDHPYNISKLGGDLLTQGYGSHGAPHALVLRLGTAYGPRMRENAVIPAFILRALRNQPIEIHGTGGQFRQFTHVDDISRAFRLALDAQDPGKIYNIVNPERITIRGLAELVVKRIPTQVVFKDPRPGDVPPAVVDSRRAEKDLGWHPKVPFKQGLEEFIDGYLALRAP